MIKIENELLKKQPKFWNHVLFHPTDAVEDLGASAFLTVCRQTARSIPFASIRCLRISFISVRMKSFATTSV